MSTFELWLGSGAAALRRRREEPGQWHAKLLARLRVIESARWDDGTAGGTRQGRAADPGDTAHRRVLELTGIIGSARAAADPAARAVTARAETQLRHVLRELCDLTLGGDPAGQEGLDVAVRRLAAAMPLPVQVTVDAVALAPAVEAAVYAVICESLGNVVGHARARRAIVTVGRHGPTVQIAVADDGEGGAQPVMGGGIVVLAARVAALGGLLHVDSRPGSGTHVTVELPSLA